MIHLSRRSHKSRAVRIFSPKSFVEVGTVGSRSPDESLISCCCCCCCCGTCCSSSSSAFPKNPSATRKSGLRSTPPVEISLKRKQQGWRRQKWCCCCRGRSSSTWHRPWDHSSAGSSQLPNCWDPHLGFCAIWNRWICRRISCQSDFRLRIQFRSQEDELGKCSIASPRIYEEMKML